MTTPDSPRDPEDSSDSIAAPVTAPASVPSARAKARHVPRPDPAEPRERRGRLLTIEDVADMLQLKRPTLYRMVSERRIPFVKLGSRLRFFENDVVRWLDENRVPSLGEDT